MAGDETLNTILEELNRMNRSINAIRQDIAEIKLELSKIDEIKEEVIDATDALMTEIQRTT